MYLLIIRNRGSTPSHLFVLVVSISIRVLHILSVQDYLGGQLWLSFRSGEVQLALLGTQNVSIPNRHQGPED